MIRQKTVLTLGIGALSVGVMIYAFDRQPEFVYFLPGWLSLNASTGGLFGSFGDYLPTFLLVYAFILLTVVVAVPSITKLLPVCLAWFTFDALFEFAQIDTIAQWVAVHTPAWFDGILFLENTLNYFLLGTFDTIDLLSITAGTVAAYITVSVLTRRVSQ
jgi:hypothetical protein